MNGGIFGLSSRCFDPIMNTYFIADDSNFDSTYYIKPSKRLLLYTTNIIYYYSLTLILINNSDIFHDEHFAAFTYSCLEQAGETELWSYSVATGCGRPRRGRGSCNVHLTKNICSSSQIACSHWASVFFSYKIKALEFITWTKILWAANNRKWTNSNLNKYWFIFLTKEVIWSWTVRTQGQWLHDTLIDPSKHS